MKGTFFNGEPDYFLERVGNLAGQLNVGSEDIKNLSIAALIAKMMGMTDDEGMLGQLRESLGVLRAAGVPARYASGYVYDPATDDRRGESIPVRGSTASHAWVQAWHPELGWVGADPTNRKLVDWQYVRVAVGRDYRDVQPLRGVFQGHPGQHLEVRVEITRLA